MRKFLEPTSKLLRGKVALTKYWKIDKNLFQKGCLDHIEGIVSSAEDLIDGDFMAHLPKLKIISHMATGIDSIDISAAKKRNITIKNTPSIATDDTADLAFGLIIALARRILINDEYIRSKCWGIKPYDLSFSLKEKKIGIVGLGEIGMAIAQRAKAFNLEILYWGREKKDYVNYKYICNLNDLAKEVNFLIISCAGNKETKNLINANVLKALGKDSFLINVSRGFVVNQDDLIYALKAKDIAGAALDVFQDEPHIPQQLLRMRNVVLQPHAGSATIETRTAMYRLVAKNILDYFRVNLGSVKIS